MSEQEKQAQGKIPELDKFHEIELEKVFDALLSIHNYRVQVGIFFGTVNLAALGVALTSQKSLVLIFAGVLLWILIVLDFGSALSLSGYYYRAIELQDRFAPDDEDFLKMFSGTAFLWARESAEISEGERHISIAGHHLPVSLRSLRTQSVAGFWLPLAASFVEIAAGFVTWLVFSWSFV